jgi:hypothetical protein
LELDDEYYKITRHLAIWLAESKVSCKGSYKSYDHQEVISFAPKFHMFLMYSDEILIFFAAFFFPPMIAGAAPTNPHPPVHGVARQAVGDEG